jgi:hypothetical protein
MNFRFAFRLRDKNQKSRTSRSPSRQRLQLGVNRPLSV